MATVFQASNLLVLPFWVLMVCVPTWTGTRRVLGSPAIIVPIALLYSILVVPNLGTILPQLANPTLPLVQMLLGSADGTTTAWIHFLAFDLWTGRWVYLDAQQSRIPVWLVSVLLGCVFMVGPFGLLAYLATRWFYTRA